MCCIKHWHTLTRDSCAADTVLWYVAVMHIVQQAVGVY